MLLWIQNATKINMWNLLFNKKTKFLKVNTKNIKCFKCNIVPLIYYTTFVSTNMYIQMHRSVLLSRFYWHTFYVKNSHQIVKKRVCICWKLCIERRLNSSLKMLPSLVTFYSRSINIIIYHTVNTLKPSTISYTYIKNSILSNCINSNVEITFVYMTNKKCVWCICVIYFDFFLCISYIYLNVLS